MCIYRAVMTVTIASLVAVGAAQAQSTSEKEALKQFGNGIVAYSDNKEVYTYVLDGTGNVSPRKLASGHDITLTHDGKWVAWVGSDNNVYVASPDGSNKRKLNQNGFSDNADYMRFSNQGTLILSEGRRKVYTLDLQGNFTLVVDESGSAGCGSYDYVSFLDMVDNLVTWRYCADVYVGTYGGSPLESGSGSRNMGQGCAQTFRTDGRKLIINAVSHKSFKLYSRNGDGWSQDVEHLMAKKYTKYHWSNVDDWVCMRGEEEGFVWAYSLSQKKKVKLSFSSSMGHDPNLYIAAAGTTVRQTARVTAARPSGTGTLHWYNVRGARIGSEPLRARGISVTVSPQGKSALERTVR